MGQGSGVMELAVSSARKQDPNWRLISAFPRGRGELYLMGDPSQRGTHHRSSQRGSDPLFDLHRSIRDQLVLW